MAASESECEKLAASLRKHFTGRTIAFEVGPLDDTYIIYVVSQEQGTVELQALLPNGWFATAWQDAEHRGWRCSIYKG
jgi:hypothetical protein